MTTRRPMTITLPLLLACLTCGAGHAQTVRFHGTDAVVTDRAIDGKRIMRPSRQAQPAPPMTPPPSTPAGMGVCAATAVAWHGQPLPDGESGTLSPISFQRSATMNDNGRIAFFAQVDGAARNQGIFTADAQGLRVVALGCGGGGGSGAPDTCGDPSPLGGTFSGFFQSTFATPDINDNGDVLFLADVIGGSSARGLFLYRASNDSFAKIAAVGDPSPLGGTITILGSGSLNNAGTVAYLAVTDSRESSDILLWQDGVTTKYVAAGDAAPDGGTFRLIGTELWGYQDGTSIAGGPVPGINDSGQVSFRGYVSGGVSAGGLFLSTNGLHEWQAKAGDTAPGGGAYIDFGAPLLNNVGEIAFFSEIADQSQTAWVVGKPGQWRRALAPWDEVDGGTVWSLAYSRNPMRALADNGDLVVWSTRIMEDQSELNTALISHANGDLQVLAVQGTETPFGGFWGGSMDGWPVINNANQVRIGSATPGFALSADAILTPCTTSDVLFRNGFDSATN